MTTRAAFDARLRALAGLQAGDSLFLATDLGEGALRASARRISAVLGVRGLFGLVPAPGGWFVVRRALSRKQQLAVVARQMALDAAENANTFVSLTGG